MPWDEYWPIADGHADTLTAVRNEHRSLFQESESGHLDLPRLLQTGVDLQVLAICAENRGESNHWASEIISQFESEMAHSHEKALWLREQSDWELWDSRGSVGFLVSLEGLEPLNGRPDTLREFHRMGVRMASLTWNHTNPFAGGAMDEGGLTGLGRDVIAMMEELGMALDLSHLNRESFWQVIEMNPKCPVLVTHANADRLCQHPRNLRDDQIKAVASLGGTIGVALFPPFLAGEIAEIRDVVTHISHIFSVGGEECVALGCDFDGIGKTPVDVKSIRDLPALFAAIKEASMGESSLAGVLGGNLCRVLRRTGS